MILIFTESEGDGIESRLPYKNFSTLAEMAEGLKIWGGDYLCGGHYLPYLVEIGLTGLPKCPPPLRFRYS